jgi:hypothetical protein
MGVEIHLLRTTFASIVELELQRRLRTVCIPPDATGQVFVDHLDVRAGSLGSLVISTSRILIRVPFDAYMVTLASLEPGAVGTTVPPGASVPLSFPSPGPRPTLEVELVPDGPAAKLICTGINVPTSQLTPFSTPILNAVNVDGELARFDLGPLFGRYGIADGLSISRISGVGSAVVLELGTTSPPVARLAPGQEWGIFFDCAANSAAVRAMLGPGEALAAAELMTGSLDVSQACFPGAVVTEIIRGQSTQGVGEERTVFSVFIAVVVTAVFATGPVPEVQLRARWSTDGSVLISGPPRPFDGPAAAAELARRFLDPAVLGATPLGDDGSFMFTRELEDQFFGETSFHLSSMTAVGNGSFFLGGDVGSFGPLDVSKLHTVVNPFPQAYGIQVSCKSGRSTDPALHGSAQLQNTSKICVTQLLSPTPAQVPLQAIGAFSPSGTTVRITPATGQILHAEGIQVRVLIRTPRGVRIANYGVPPDPDYNASGVPRNVVMRFRSDCFGDFRQPNIRYIVLGEWAVLLDSPYPPPVPIDRGGFSNNQLHDIAVFETGIARVHVDQVGDAVILERPGQKQQGPAYFTANAGNVHEVTVPLFAVIGPNTASGARLSKLSRASMVTQGGTVTSHTKTFTRLAMLTRKGAISHALASDETEGAAVVTTTYADGKVEVTLVTAKGVVSGSAGKGSGSGLVDAPSPSDAMQKWASDAKETGALAGVTSVYYIPGFENEQVAVAKLGDGAGAGAGYRLLTRASSQDNGELGDVAVTGLMPEWPGLPPVAGDWAISGTSGTYVSVYRVDDNGKEEMAPFIGKVDDEVTATDSILTTAWPKGCRCSKT